jgi:protease-4
VVSNRNRTLTRAAAASTRRRTHRTRFSMANDAPDATPAATIIKPGAGSPPPQIILQQSMFGWMGKALIALIVILVMVIIGMVSSYREYFNDPEKPQERFHSLARHGAQKIAIINVSGAIMEGDGFVKRQIDAVAEDASVVAVVLRVNSPGGTVTGSDFIYHHLRQLLEKRQIPLVVSMGSLCASGGYYLAMAAGDKPDVLYAEPMTITGSIGVVMPHYDLSGLLGLWSVKDDSLATGPLKQMGSPTKPMSESDRKALEAILADMFAGFKEVVTYGRPKFKADPAALDAVATGQVFTAKQALDRGLIDKIGFLEEAILRAADLAGVSTDDVRCVRYVPPTTFMGQLLGAQASAAKLQFDAATLLDLAAPRAYYIWTAIPALATSQRVQ